MNLSSQYPSTGCANVAALGPQTKTEPSLHDRIHKWVTLFRPAAERKDLGYICAGKSDKQPATGQQYSNHKLPVSQPQYNAKVVVAEDNQINQFVVREIMKIFGLNPIIVSDGQGVVDLVGKEEIDLIIMDVNMPVMDGVEATTRIRNLENTSVSKKRIPIIAFTANEMDGDREKYLKAGMDDFLTKPIEVERLAQILDQWL